MNSCVMTLFWAFDRGAIPARARWSVARRESGWGRRRRGPARATGRNRRSRGVNGRGVPVGWSRPATIGGHSEKLVEAGFEIGVDCWPPEMLGEGSDGQGLRWASRGSVTPRERARGTSSPTRLERGSERNTLSKQGARGWEEVAMVSRGSWMGTRIKPLFGLKVASKAEVQTLAGSLGGSRRFFPPDQTRDDAPIRPASGCWPNRSLGPQYSSCTYIV